MEAPRSLLITLFLLAAAAAPGAGSSVPEASFPVGPERRAHLQFYIHDKVSSPNATAVNVAFGPSGRIPSSTALNFASLFVVDDLLTVGPDPSSKAIGRARGFYAVSSLNGVDLYFTVQVIFTDGPYKGSSLAVIARDPITEPVRELPVVGGTGIFRLARGFAFMRTHQFNVTTRDAVLYVDAYILHH
ncbi:Disease resistance response protein 206 [Apostasia shenzhenica]|uniref:Dirigent protein n=1 Tax=Apostasia shenzhenica TaxID=1088818 RepID=A0A2I0ANK9_9ASPA|nr:Disease resistance response protein 206 [Apostasia shenzhenica]